MQARSDFSAFLSSNEKDLSNSSFVLVYKTESILNRDVVVKNTLSESAVEISVSPNEAFALAVSIINKYQELMSLIADQNRRQSAAEFNAKHEKTNDFSDMDENVKAVKNELKKVQHPAEYDSASESKDK